MKRPATALAFRAFALVGLMAVNWVLPVRAEAPCYSCVEINNVFYCFELVWGEGHTYCEPHGDHCDEVGGCYIPPD